MSTLSISVHGALNQNQEVNRHRIPNGVIVGAQMPNNSHSAKLSAVNATRPEKTAVNVSAERAAIVPPTSQQHVVVVGAGISGLRAASVLQRHGVAVTILEGRPDRIGGRISTTREPGKAAKDIGKYT
jgi:polyamine oxidase